MTQENDIFARPSVFAGARAPQGVTVVVTPGKRNINLLSVTAVRFRVRIGLDANTDRVWSTSVSVQRCDKLVATHQFDSAGLDTSKPGRYRLIPELVVPTGIVQCAAFYLGVKP
jgi:hypothetical protein